MDKLTSDAAQAAIDWANQGIGFAMNRYNADPATETKKASRLEKPSKGIGGEEKPSPRK